MYNHGDQIGQVLKSTKTSRILSAGAAMSIVESTLILGTALSFSSKGCKRSNLGLLFQIWLEFETIHAFGPPAPQ
ncbi:MAG: hypothetical protein ACJAUZ_001115 [Flavobacteriaceae bacterium]